MKIFLVEQTKYWIRYLVLYNHIKLYAKRGHKHEGFHYRLKEVHYHYHPPYKRTKKHSLFYFAIGFRDEAFPDFYFDRQKEKVFRQEQIL